MRSLYRVFQASEDDGSPQLGAWVPVSDELVRWRCPECAKVHELAIDPTSPTLVLDSGPARIVAIECCRIVGALALARDCPDAGP